MSINSQQLTIAVCGHIDHGKSTLIGRLLLDTRSLSDDKLKELKNIAKNFGEETQLAYLSDQLKEERERNITIETTQIFLKTHKRPYCLIDTPGHLEFIRNMLTGTSQAQAALLLVDIQEGIADQTRRHAYLLKFLSITNIIVVVNKMDLVEYSQRRFEEIKKELLILFSELQIKAHLIIPICAKSAENISHPSKKMRWYHGPCLINGLDALTSNDKNTNTNFRLPVQDIYTQSKERIIVGRIASGRVSQGEKAVVMPFGKTTTVQSLKIFGKNKKSAETGESIGLTLGEDVDIKRGDILCTIDKQASATKSFYGNIFWLSDKELLQGQTITLQCSTQRFTCQVTKIIEAIDPTNLKVIERNAKSLKQNQAALIEFTLLAPALLEKYSDVAELGRYTIESGNELCAAGTVLSVTKE